MGGVEFHVRINTGNSDQALARIRKALGQYGATLQQTTRQTNQASRALGGFEEAAANLGIAFATRQLSNFLAEATILAARVQNLETVVQNVGQTAGKTAAQIRNIEDSTKRLGITTQNARSSIALLAQAELDLANSARLARIAQDAAVIAGINSSDAFQRLVVAIQRNDSRLLRNLGIVVNLNQVYSKFTQRVGRSVQSLTAVEKRQLLLNEVFEKGKVIAGTYEAALTDVHKRYTSMDRLTEEATRTFGEQFIPVMEVAVDTTSEFLKNFAKDESRGMRQFFGSVAVGVVTLGSLVTAAAAAKVAMLGITALGGPLTLAFVGVAAAVGGIVGAFQSAAAEARAFKENLEEIEKEQAGVVARDVEVRKLTAEIEELADKTERTAAETAELESKLQQVATLMPELERSLNRLIEAKEFDAAVTEIQTRGLGGLIDNEEALAEAQRNRANILNRVNTILEEAGTIQAEAFQNRNLQVVLRNLKEDGKGIVDETGRIREELLSLVGRKASDPAKTLFQPALNESIDTVNRFEEELQELNEVLIQQNTIIEQTKIQQRALEFQDLQAIAQKTEALATQSLEQIKQVATARRKVFRDTEIEILDDLAQHLAKARGMRFRNEEQIQEFQEKAIAVRQQQLAERTKAQREALEEELKAAQEAGEGVAEVRRKIADFAIQQRDARAAIINNVTDEANALRRALKDIAEGNDAALELVRLRLSDVRDEIAKIRQETEQINEGTDNRLINILNTLSSNADEAKVLMDEARKRIKELKEELASADASDVNLISQLGAQLQANQDVLKAIGDRTAAERERALAKLNRIERQKAEERKRIYEQTEDFIVGSQLRIADQVAGGGTLGFSELDRQFRELRDRINQAVDPENIERMLGLVGPLFQRVVNEQRRSLREAKEALRDFRDDREFKELDIKQEIDEERARLLRAGVDPREVQRRTELKRQRAAQELREEEERLEREVNQRESGLSEIEQQRRDQAEHLKTLAEQRTAALEEQRKKQEELFRLARGEAAAKEDTLETTKKIINLSGTKDPIGKTADASKLADEQFIRGSRSARVAELLQKNQREGGKATVESAASLLGGASARDKAEQSRRAATEEAFKELQKGNQEVGLTTLETIRLLNEQNSLLKAELEAEKERAERLFD